MNGVKFNKCTLNATSLNRVGSHRGAMVFNKYELVDYVLFDGKSAVDTGIVINKADFHIVMDAAFTDIVASSPEMLCGFMGGDASLPRCGIGVYSSKWLFSPNTTSTISTPDTDRHIFESVVFLDGNTYKYQSLLDGESIQANDLASASSFDTNAITFHIGDRNNNGKLANFGTGKVYGLTLYVGGKKVGDFAPAVRKADGVVGMLNLVNGDFLTNIGTGTLEAGREKPSKDYRVLTGITMNDDTYYCIDGFRLRGSDSLNISFSAQKACNIVGSYTTTNATDNYSIFASTTANAKYLRYNGGTYLSAIEAGKRYDIHITPTGCTGFDSASTWTEKDFEASVDMLVGSTSTGATSAKLLGTIYGNIEVVGRLMLVPVERKIDGVIGYYDLYTGIFYAPVIGKPVALGYADEGITFSVEGYDAPFTAEAGMNWMQFCSSSYNTEGWECYSEDSTIWLYGEQEGWSGVDYYLEADGGVVYGGSLVEARAYTIYAESFGFGGGM